jgi:GMP synthase-like glutamine amidotransferase
MSVNDDATLPWLAAEKQLIADAVASGKSVFGICLGAQLIASALGAKVYANPESEIGWHAVRAVGGPATPFVWPRRIRCFHWHGDTFDLPPKATLLASSVACFHQAFCVGQRVVGLQFHPEATRDSVAALVAESGTDLPVGEFIQSAADMLGEPDDTYGQGQQLLRSLLETIVSATDQTV